MRCLLLATIGALSIALVSFLDSNLDDDTSRVRDRPIHRFLCSKGRGMLPIVCPTKSRRQGDEQNCRCKEGTNTVDIQT